MAKKFYVVALFASLSVGKALAAPQIEKVCAFAPSQSKPMSTLASAAGGAAGAAAAVAQTAGLSVVAHSSGAAILTGSGGYVTGTLGAASTGPAIVVVGLVLAGTAVAIELVCAPKNHPREVAKVEAAATEFTRRSGVLWDKASSAVTPAVSQASVVIKQVSGNAIAYAYRRLP